MICNVTDCNRSVYPHGAKGLCPKHYKRHRAHGNAEYKKIAYPEERNTEFPSYNAVHLRIKSKLGTAKEYLCVVCDNQASDWACIANKNAKGVNDGKPVMYSYNMDDYLPMCRPCHNQFDNVGRIG